MNDGDLTSKDAAKLAATTDLMDRLWAPCRDACPVHADVRAYLEAAAQGRWRDAIDIIRERLPLAGVCGRICHHPCEANCRRRDVDDPVAIREVKRFVAELEGAAGSTVHKAPVQNKARVAIVGGGPAGLSAALDLAMAGYRPTIFEKFPRAGGIPATAVPAYRLPREVIQIDVDWIVAHGVRIVTGVEIGKDKTLDDLHREGFEAVLVAAGLACSRPLPIPGVDHPRVYPALELLTGAAFGKPPELGRQVLVIGGGNVAVDAARTALRLGAERVSLMCLESEEEMPAFTWEQREAREEGIDILHRRGPTEVVVQGGHIVGVKTRAVTRVFDENRRFDPRYNDADVTEVPCDTVIIAIGQAPDMGFLRGSSLKADERGRLPCDRATLQTSVPWVFACGEIVTPPGSVVEACASGHRAACAIGLYLSGKTIKLDDSVPPKIDTIAAETAKKVTKVSREPVETLPPDARKRNFAEVDKNYIQESALRESRRCMSCGAGADVLVDKCSACLTCLRVCPFDIPKITDVARIESALCQSCGICIAECPANAIIARGWDARAMPARARKAMDAAPGDGPKVVAFVSGHRASAAQWRGEAKRPPGVAVVYLPSVARLSTRDLLCTLEEGAAAVVVAALKEEAERYPQAMRRARRRFDQARQLLAEIGIPADRLRWLELADAGDEAVCEALAGAAAASS